MLSPRAELLTKHLVVALAVALAGCAAPRPTTYSDCANMLSSQSWSDPVDFIKAAACMMDVNRNAPAPTPVPSPTSAMKLRTAG